MIDVLRARKRIAPYVRRTPLVESAWLSDVTGAHVSLKLESLQASNSFKSRGAFNAVIAPIGGGGLISGIGSTIKNIDATRLVIGVELEVSNAFQTSVRAGKLVEIVAGTSIADGLGGNPDPETITFWFVQRHVDQIVTVSEADLKAGVVALVEQEHLVVEASGAAGVAALVGRRIAVADWRVVVMVTGSNVDRARLTAMLGSG